MFDINEIAREMDGKYIRVLIPGEHHLRWIICYFDTCKQRLPASRILDIEYFGTLLNRLVGSLKSSSFISPVFVIVVISILDSFDCLGAGDTQ